MPEVVTLGDAWRVASQRIDRLDARLLLEHVCGCTHSDLIAHPERELTLVQNKRFYALWNRREVGEPLAYLVGSAFFYGLEFSVSSAVLIPRPDTEVLVNRALEEAKKFDAPCIVDLGTGSGVVAIMLARLCPAAQVTAIDLSAVALDVARVNAERHSARIRFLEGDWFSPLGDERFHLIVSNPPYVADGDPHLQENGLPFEPQQALTDGVAGGNGLACIRHLVSGVRNHLLPGGWILIEHGYDQAVEVRQLLKTAGFTGVGSWQDGAGIDRVSGGCSP